MVHFAVQKKVLKFLIIKDFKIFHLSSSNKNSCVVLIISIYIAGWITNGNYIALNIFNIKIFSVIFIRPIISPSAKYIKLKLVCSVILTHKRTSDIVIFSYRIAWNFFGAQSVTVILKSLGKGYYSFLVDRCDKYHNRNNQCNSRQ